MSGTFDEIYETVKRVPPGKVAYYSQIAALTGAYSGRVVGFAMASCRDESVPCHRIVDKAGNTKTAFDIYGSGTQRMLLAAEGVAFLPDGRVDMDKCLWQP